MMLWSTTVFLFLVSCAAALQISIPSTIYVNEPATYGFSSNTSDPQTGFVGVVMYESNTIGLKPQPVFKCPQVMTGGKFEGAKLVPAKDLAGGSVSFTPAITGTHVICVFGNMTEFHSNLAVANPNAPLLFSTAIFNVYEPVYIGTIISVSIGVLAVLFIAVCAWQDYKKRERLTYEYIV